MSDTTARFLIVEPSADRHDSADVPAYIRSAVQQVEALGAIFGQGTFAARPAAGVQGRIYAARDLVPPRLYYDDGSTWFDVGLVGNGIITDAMLASPHNAVPHALAEASVMLQNGEHVLGTNYIIGSGGEVLAPGLAGSIGAVRNNIPFFWLDSARFAIAGKTPQLQLWAQLMLNGVDWVATNVAAEVRPLIPAGGANGVVNFTLGAALATRNFTGPRTNSTISTSFGGDIAFPGTPGLYAFGFTVSNVVLPANATALLSAQLMMRWT